MIGRRALIWSGTAGLLALRANPADKTIRYDFVHEAGEWKVDDIKGAVDGNPWSVGALLVESLKR
jgi:hypothetical protein